MQVDDARIGFYDDLISCGLTVRIRISENSVRLSLSFRERFEWMDGVFVDVVEQLVPADSLQRLTEKWWIEN
ncbi:hypothetical protein T11_13264 [Trichinella zimbabwensis]|uniref:Uncharacterized protein n=1 Tax=Trichinella zimbabwensis TaxID=268475 RepID=A0A0V1HVB7_9BILA|nr:hypothetical protein T11_13264 [Trichinella zimbabwensis]